MMYVFQVFIKFGSSERNAEYTITRLYLNEESNHSEENACKNGVFRSTILHHRKKLKILTPQLPICYIQYKNRKSRLVRIPEAAIAGILWKKVFFKISQNLQEILFEFCEISKNTFFTEQFQTTASETPILQKRSGRNRLSLF